MKTLYVYVAGPLSQGDPMENVRNVLAVAERIRQRGHIPFVPHLSMFWNMFHPTDYERWMDYDLAWLMKCDVLVRVDGPSHGSDREVWAAKATEKPVFYGLDEFMKSPLWASA